MTDKNQAEAEVAAAGNLVPEAFIDRTYERYQSLPLAVRFAILIMSLGGISASIIYIFGLTYYVGLPAIFDISYYFFLMAMFMPMVYLLMPAYKKEVTAGIFSYAPAILFFVLAMFLTTKGRALNYQTWIPPNEWQMWLSVAMFLLVLEAGRRVGGTIFLCIVIFFGLYPVFAEYMPGIMWGPPMSVARTLAFNVYSSDALLGIVTRVVGETLIGCLILAALLVATGAADFFLKIALALMGTARGGPAKVAVIASGFFGSLSGSIFWQCGRHRFSHYSQHETRWLSQLLRRSAGSMRLNRRHVDAPCHGRSCLHHGRFYRHRICGDCGRGHHSKRTLLFRALLPRGCLCR